MAIRHVNSPPDYIQYSRASPRYEYRHGDPGTTPADPRTTNVFREDAALRERPKYSDKDPRGGTDQSANKQHGEQLSRLEWPLPTPVPSEEAPGVRIRTPPRLLVEVRDWVGSSFGLTTRRSAHFAATSELVPG
jgi:hypothetical protein